MGKHRKSNVSMIYNFPINFSFSLFASILHSDFSFSLTGSCFCSQCNQLMNEMFVFKQIEQDGLSALNSHR